SPSRRADPERRHRRTPAGTYSAPINAGPVAGTSFIDATLAAGTYDYVVRAIHRGADLSAFTVADIRKKLAFTALLLALYRLGSHIPVPGVNAQAVEDIQSNFGNGNILGLLNTFSGG